MAAVALKAGCDLSCDHVYYENLAEAVERGLVSEAVIDQALERTLGTRFNRACLTRPGRCPSPPRRWKWWAARRTASWPIKPRSNRWCC